LQEMSQEQLDRIAIIKAIHSTLRVYEFNGTNADKLQACEEIHNFVDELELLVTDDPSTMFDVDKEADKKEVREAGATNPTHYSKYSIEPIDYIMANHLPFCEGNIVKYISRWRDKNGLEDLKKARVYINFLISQEEDKT